MSWDDAPCNARHDDVTSIVCGRPKGHSGDHEGTTWVTWENEDN